MNSLLDGILDYIFLSSTSSFPFTNDDTKTLKLHLIPLMCEVVPATQCN